MEALHRFSNSFKPRIGIWLQQRHHDDVKVSVTLQGENIVDRDAMVCGIQGKVTWREVQCDIHLVRVLCSWNLL